ncbi:hypothetical protein A2U01_0077754, partial [Trifolium medium]|nr:hypothetical protein [Trifolium medium]
MSQPCLFTVDNVFNMNLICVWCALIIVDTVGESGGAREKQLGNAPGSQREGDATSPPKTLR